MTALARAQTNGNTTLPARNLFLQVVNAAAIYYNGGVAIDTTPGTTTAIEAVRGRARAFTSAKNRIYAGLAGQTVTGNTTTSPPVSLNTYDDDNTTLEITVAGLKTTAAEWINDVGQMVYMSDDNTWSITRAAYNLSYGFVTGRRSSTTAMVRQYRAIDAMQATYTRANNNVVVGVAGAAGSDTVGSIDVPELSTVDSAYVICSVVGTGTGPFVLRLKRYTGTSTLQITGASLNITAASMVVGTRLDFPSITAANRVHEGERVLVHLTRTDTGLGGVLDVHCLMTRKLGT